MRQVEKRSNTEIAQILGIGKDSVCALLSKARASLLNDLRQRMEAEEKRMSKLKKE
jgi:RNA polymerase sigma-70 factor (ECF subfamily)